MQPRPAYVDPAMEIQSRVRHPDSYQKSPFAIAHPAGGIRGYFWEVEEAQL
jgi:hypothetical protein